MSTKQNLEKLARYRTIGARHSDEVFKLGSQALASGGRGLGEQGECCSYSLHQPRLIYVVQNGQSENKSPSLLSTSARASKQM